MLSLRNERTNIIFMSSNLGSELWNEGLKLVSFCPVCETRYNPMEARVLGSQGETHLLHVQCRKCLNSILALVLVNQVGASSVGLLTDLSYEDVLRFKANQKVVIDDVIEIHTLLRSSSWQKVFGGEISSHERLVVPKRKKREKNQQKNKATR